MLNLGDAAVGTRSLDAGITPGDTDNSLGRGGSRLGGARIAGRTDRTGNIGVNGSHGADERTVRADTTGGEHDHGASTGADN